MKKPGLIIALFVMFAVSAITSVKTASAEDVTMIGLLTRVELAADGKSATAVLKDKKSGEPVTIIVADELTLDKIKDKRIVEGDEIRSKFEKKDGINRSRIFKKTAGC